jgi:hypothetical protein
MPHCATPPQSTIKNQQSTIPSPRPLLLTREEAAAAAAGLAEGVVVRCEMDRLGIGQKITAFQWGSKTVKLPPSSLK